MGPHRADIVTPEGWVIELQHSSIGPEEIEEREAFYGPRMVWIFDAVKARDENRFRIRERDGYQSFRWCHPRKSILSCRRIVFLDLGDGVLFRLRRLYETAPHGGWGRIVRSSDLLRRAGALCGAAS